MVSSFVYSPASRAGAAVALWAVLGAHVDAGGVQSAEWTVLSAEWTVLTGRLHHDWQIRFVHQAQQQRGC